MRIGVIGGGVVGRATARAWLEWAEVRLHDSLPERSTHSLEQAADADLVFLCLPTPADPRRPGRLDLTALDDVCAALRGRGANLVLRSTVPVGTTRRLSEQYGLPNLVHCPEFLTARCAHADAQLPARNVIGAPPSRGRAALAAACARRFPGVPVHLLSWEESELVKLAQNGFFAVKIAFWNEVYAAAEALELDWDGVLAAVLADGRISHAHTRVPGPSGQRGFGGACLPKDLECLVSVIENRGLSAAVTRAAAERNEEDRRR